MVINQIYALKEIGGDSSKKIASAERYIGGMLSDL